jgi:hypothetical protein
MDVLWPNDAGVMMSRAVLLGREKRNDEALAVLDAVAAQNPDGKLGPNELLEAATTKRSPTSPKESAWPANSAATNIWISTPRS